MGAGQPAAAGPDSGASRPDFALDLGSLETSEPEALGPPAGFAPLPVGEAIDLMQLLGDIAGHLAFEAQAWEGAKFPTQPKPGTEWWATVKGGNEVLQRRVAAMLAEVAA